MNYLDTLNIRTKEYFDVLEPDFPLWLVEYINTKSMLKQQYISITCGTIYSNLFKSDYFFSSLDHSIGVALIIWHFTHDKKQTLSGLFHDIATPVFKHCIDFLNGDYVKQESTEDLTKKIILDSTDIMNLLKRDNILVEEICDYHLYPIADNDTPKLSSDRLEYSLSNGLLTYNLLTLDEVKEIYCDLEVQKDEFNVDEISFKTKSIARKFVKLTSKLSVIYMEDRTRYSMQFLADLIKRLYDKNIINMNMLYEMKESQIIDIINLSEYSGIFNIWKSASKVKSSNIVPNVYYINFKTKIRYIDPLVNGKRISKICKIANNMINKNLSFDMSKYVYIDNIVF